MKDIYGAYKTLSEIVGQHWAIGLFAIGIVSVCVFLWYFRLVLPKGTLFEEDSENSKAERDSYQAWRVRLTQGGRIGPLYDRLLERALNRVDKFFGDDPTSDTLLEAQRAPTWTAPSLDKCLLLALIYPIVSLTVIWHISGITGPTELALGFTPETKTAVRALSAISSLFLMGIGIWVCSSAFRQLKFRYKIVSWIAVAGAGAFTVAGTVAGAGTVTVAVAVTFAVAVAVAVAFVVAFTFADTVEVAVAGAVAGAVAVAVAGAGAGAGAFAGASSGAVLFVFNRVQNTRGYTAFLLSFMVLYLFLIFLVTLLITPRVELEVKPEWTLLVFLGAFPIINAFFDWLSLGLTRFLLRRGQRQGGAWPLIYAMVDLFSAVMMLFVLMIAALLYIKILNYASVAGGGGLVLNVELLTQRFASNPSDPSLWWVYVTIFTTFIPSLVNLVLGGLAILRGLPVVTRYLSHQLPDNPAHLTLVKRAFISGGLTLQIGIALLGSLLIAYVFFSVTFKGLGKVGWSLLNVAQRLV